jgi:hypothetical protein
MGATECPWGHIGADPCSQSGWPTILLAALWYQVHSNAFVCVLTLLFSSFHSCILFPCNYVYILRAVYPASDINGCMFL